MGPPLEAENGDRAARPSCLRVATIYSSQARPLAKQPTIPYQKPRVPYGRVPVTGTGTVPPLLLLVNTADRSKTPVR